MSRIFISYRRSDAAAEAGRIYDALEPHFGRESIFMDVDALEAGEDFRARLREAVGQCQVLLAVISKGWLDAQDASGRRRLDNPADWVRLEIEAALVRNIRVIPVLSEGVVMPLSSKLPKSLQPLVYRHAAFVRHNRDFRNDMEALQGVLQRHFDALADVQPTVKLMVQPTRLPVPPVQQPVRKVVPQGRVAQKQSPRQIPARVVSSVAIPRARFSPEVLTSLGKIVSRRRMLQVLGYSGAGIGSVLFSKALFQSGGSLSNSYNWRLPALEAETIDGTTAEFNVATVNASEKSIAIVRDRADFVTEDLGGGVTLDMMEIPGGTFTMGSPDSEAYRRDTEGPQHDVSVSSFFMGKYPVTQAQWRVVAALPKIERDLNLSPSFFSGDNRPVEQVSWWEAVEFCQRLSAKLGVEYRLPSEAEWEYACRAGTTTPFHVGDTLTADLTNYRATAVYGDGPKGKYYEETMVVGSFPANAFGLYDMHGNVWEWCADHWHDSYEGALSDGSAWLTDNSAASRLRRGGSWGLRPWLCRSAYRSAPSPSIANNNCGFRLGCSAPRTLG